MNPDDQEESAGEQAAAEGAGEAPGPDEEPMVLELAPLPREQIGPFLLLGLDKDADREAIEAHWAQRVIWARKNLIHVALQEINWAREVLNDPLRRVRADVSSLNPDTTGQELRALAERLGAGEPGGPTWRPLDAERPLSDYSPAVPVPDPEEVRRAIAVPEAPPDAPAVAALLRQLLQEPLDPWAPPLPAEEGVPEAGPPRQESTRVEEGPVQPG